MNATPPQTIRLIVGPDGSATVETQGFSGSACQDASRFLETALGEKRSETLTAEFYRQDVSRTRSRPGSSNPLAGFFHARGLRYWGSVRKRPRKLVEGDETAINSETHLTHGDC